MTNPPLTRNVLLQARLPAAVATLLVAVGCTDLGSPLPEKEIGSEPPPPEEEIRTLVATRDNTLYETAGAPVSNGAGQHVFAGRIGSPDGLLRRALVAFDVAAGIPAGATITAVAISLHLSRTNDFAGGVDEVALHRVHRGWGEGASQAPGNEGGGAPPTAGDATWFFAMSTTQRWAVAGGDFAATAGAKQSVGLFDAADDANNFATWTGAGLVQDVQSMLDDPGSDFGWIVLGDETDLFSAKRFDSRENGTAEHRPILTVRYRPAALR